MFNRSMFMISTSAILCVCCGLSFADPSTDSQNGKEILKEVQAQREAALARGLGYAFEKVRVEDIFVKSGTDLVGNEIARATRVRRRGNGGAYNYQYGTAPVKKNEPQKEEKTVKDEQPAAAKDDAVKQEQKDAQDAAQTEQKDVQDAAQTERKDAKDAAQTEQKDVQDAAQTEQKDVQDAAQTEQKEATDTEAKKDDNAAKEEVKKEEPASPFKDPQEALAFEEFNKFRVRNGLKPCEFNQNLQNIAKWHSNNMYSRQQMYHSGASGVAENVFMGSSSGVYAVRVWMNSPGHRANMLGPYRRVGIARTGGFYTMVLQ